MNAKAFELLMAARGAETYADFLLPHLLPDMDVLDLGCGRATITMGLADAVPQGRIVGVDLDASGFTAAYSYAESAGRRNVELVVADGRHLPFRDAAFDASFCHSVLEAVAEPEAVVGELSRVTSANGVVGAASVDYGGLIIEGTSTSSPRRFYEIRMQLWRSAGIADPFMGRRLRGLFERAGFTRVEAFAHYISYGSRERVRNFARQRVEECQDEEFGVSLGRYGIASSGELAALAAGWEHWGEDSEAFLAFPWCRVLGWRRA